MAVIKSADMPYEMQSVAIDFAFNSMRRHKVERDIACFLKKEFDRKYQPTWHCVVGRNFGSFVTHRTKHFIHFYMGQLAILLFKTEWRSKQFLFGRCWWFKISLRRYLKTLLYIYIIFSGSLYIIPSRKTRRQTVTRDQFFVFFLLFFFAC